jgi:2-oxoglutarate dehydrogenase E2 component (dihydrolipoamide succinyltransferase)
VSVEVKIPPVGESITSGVVSVWHKKSGEYVNAGDALFTLETDKVSTEITAEKAGVLETKVPEGQEVKIGEVVAIIDESQSAPAAGSAKGDGQSAAPPLASDQAALSPAVRRAMCWQRQRVDL